MASGTIRAVFNHSRLVRNKVSTKH
jgi:hypothetical protein